MPEAFTMKGVAQGNGLSLLPKNTSQLPSAERLLPLRAGVKAPCNFKQPGRTSPAASASVKSSREEKSLGFLFFLLVYSGVQQVLYWCNPFLLICISVIAERSVRQIIFLVHRLGLSPGYLTVSQLRSGAVPEVLP